MPSGFVLVLYVLSVVRLTTLVTHDELTRPIRSWLIAKFNPHSRVHRALVYLLGEPDGEAIGCPWCISIWTGFVTSPIVFQWGDTSIITIIMLALSASQITGMIYMRGRQ